MNNKDLEQFIKKITLLGFTKARHSKGLYTLSGTPIIVCGLHKGEIVIYFDEGNSYGYTPKDPKHALNKLLEMIKDYEL